MRSAESKETVMSQSCARWRGDIGAYILDALDPERGSGLRRHMEACAACRADYEDLLPVRDWLSRLVTADESADHLARWPPPCRPPYPNHPLAPTPLVAFAPTRPPHLVQRRRARSGRADALARGLARRPVLRWHQRGRGAHRAVPPDRGDPGRPGDPVRARPPVPQRFRLSPPADRRLIVLSSSSLCSHAAGGAWLAAARRRSDGHDRVERCLTFYTGQPFLPGPP